MNFWQKLFGKDSDTRSYPSLPPNFYNSKAVEELEKRYADPLKFRSFSGAEVTRYTSWKSPQFQRLNQSLAQDLINLISRTRSLAINDPLVRAYLELCEKNIVGKAGFNLQCQLKNADGKLNETANSAIEWAFWDFGKLSNGYLTMDHGMRTS